MAIESTVGDDLGCSVAHLSLMTTSREDVCVIVQASRFTCVGNCA